MDISYDPNLVVFNTDACVITKQNCNLFLINYDNFDPKEFQVGISIINKIASCLSDIPETIYFCVYNFNPFNYMYQSLLSS